jgi:hypothetical protein
MPAVRLAGEARMTAPRLPIRLRLSDPSVRPAQNAG